MLFGLHSRHRVEPEKYFRLAETSFAFVFVQMRNIRRHLALDDIHAVAQRHMVAMKLFEALVEVVEPAVQVTNHLMSAAILIGHLESPCVEPREKQNPCDQTEQSQPVAYSHTFPPLVRNALLSGSFNQRRNSGEPGLIPFSCRS